MSKPDSLELWEVFVQTDSRQWHVHVGSVHAADAEMALQNARDTYSRRGNTISIWVVPSKGITATTRRDKEPFFDPSNDKIYRHARFYTASRNTENEQDGNRD